MPRTAPKPIRPFHLDFTPLRQRRRFLEVTHIDLAKAVGLNRVTLWRTEKNRSAPTVEQLVAVSRALGVPMHTLFLVHDGPRPARKEPVDGVPPRP